MRLAKDILLEYRLLKLTLIYLSFFSLVVCCRKLVFHLILVAELSSMKDSKPASPGKVRLLPIRALGIQRPRFISTVRSTVRTNPSRNWAFRKHGLFVFMWTKTFWKQSFQK